MTNADLIDDILDFILIQRSKDSNEVATYGYVNDFFLIFTPYPNEKFNNNIFTQLR